MPADGKMLSLSRVPTVEGNEAHYQEKQQAKRVVMPNEYQSKGRYAPKP